MPGNGKVERTNELPRHHSIFFKLFVVMLGSVILTYLAFGGFYRSDWNVNDRVKSHPSLIYYWRLVADKIGYPPDTALASQISSQIGVAIGITGPTLNWHSKNFSEYIRNQSYPSYDTLQGEPIQLDLHAGRIWGIFPKNGYTYYLGSRKRTAWEGVTTDSKTLLFVIGLVWLMTWITLRRMLYPLLGLEAGVQALESGDLEVQIPEKGRDEFARLARSFNGMTRSLREQIKSRDRLLLDVSHELRSPLTRMRVALEMAVPGKAVDSLRRQLDSLERMVTEILETERLKSVVGGLRLDSTDLGKIVQEKVDLYMEQGIQISWHAEQLPPMLLDAERMRLVLQNIIENGVKYGQNASRPMEISLRNGEGTAVLEVRDFGQGIPDADLQFVFEPFYRADRSRSRAPGYGLGLSLCKRIVEMHGGNILLESRLGEGTKIRIELPLN